MRDVFAVELDAPARGCEDASEQVDERRLAGAVGTDEGVPRSRLDGDREVLRRGDSAEALLEAMSAENGRRHRVSGALGLLVRCNSFSRSSRAGSASRSLPTSTMATSIIPIQNCQYCGVHEESTSYMSLNAMAPMRPPYR